MVRWSIAAGLVAFAWLSTPTPALAANGLRPRTPAQFAEPPCVMQIDAGAVTHFEYSVPFDDTMLTPDELTDSRQMQFFAFRNVPFDYALPTYIAQEDFDRAEANGDNTKPYSADDILETASAYPSGEWVAITPNDARVPITIEQAEMGFGWDTTDAGTGGFLVAGYTWEPENNLWSFRLGAVRVVDPADPDAAGPAGFIQTRETADINGTVADMCIDAAPGSTYTVSYGALVGIDEPTWIPIVEDQPIDDTTEIEFVPEVETLGQSIKVRLEITDPAGQRFVVYSPFPVPVTGTPAGTGGSDESGDADGGQDDDAGGGGCSCRVDRPTPAVVGLLALFVLGLRRRSPVA